jgi:hypothetical protein
LPFGGRLRADNRWVELSKLIPWLLVEELYTEKLSSDRGAPAISSRMAFGALFLKEYLTTTDRGVVEQISENPYLQYFLGLDEFVEHCPFDASMMVHFRKRFGSDLLSKINEQIVALEQQKQKDKNASGKKPKPDSDDDSPATGIKSDDNDGKLLIDATCTPADIRYPTDLSLLNEAREKLEKIIDCLYEPLKGKIKKPRTYRQKARKLFVRAIRSAGKKNVPKSIGQQLRFVRRDLGHIKRIIDKEGASLSTLSRKLYKNLLVIHTLYEQQRFMYENRIRRVENRIVSIHQPHVRPIIRGKAKQAVEFGAKISLSLTKGYAFLDRLNWDAYNEVEDLRSQAEAYRRRFGVYPKVICADQIYRSRSNRRWCNEQGIRLSGLGPGRPPKDKILRKGNIAQARQDEIQRIPIEGKFGQAKRRFCLERVMTKLAQTSECVVAMVIIVMNLIKILCVFMRNSLFGLKNWISQQIMYCVAFLGLVSHQKNKRLI